jgi:hypothetical protein
VNGAPKRGLLAWLARRSYLVVLALLLLFLFFYARSHRLADAIERDYLASGMTTIDLPRSVPQAWQRVCVLGPYSSARDAGALLGFDWNADAHSRVRDHEDAVLLIFASGNIVVGAADYPRADGDLSPLASHCYPRSAARFSVRSGRAIAPVLAPLR